jgi:hypothetical protein
MTPRYVEVSRESLEGFLASKQFVRTTQCSEVVYVFSHLKNPHVKIKVYTSLGVGRRWARPCGEDAIRVATVFEDGVRSFGIGKFPKVLRTGSEEAILERIYDRIREAYRFGSSFIRNSYPRANQRPHVKGPSTSSITPKTESASSGGSPQGSGKYGGVVESWIQLELESLLER